MIKKTVRDQSYSLNDYLGYVNDGDICDNPDVQRLAGCFDNREVNELIYTVLTSDHIPELILAECNEDNRTYITDGLQRTTMLMKFRHQNFKISSAIDNPIVEYMKKKRDENGNILKNERGQIELEEAEFNIKNKTFEMLPEELQKMFNDFQIRIVIHEDCTMKRISELIKRYNYQRAMTTPQQAFTYMDNYAVAARGITNKKFFIECEGYTPKERINGTIERIVSESVMCIYHFEDWKTSPKDVCKYLNKNSTEEEFIEFDKLIGRLGLIFNPNFNKIFTSKNSFIWFKLFNNFSSFGLPDSRFADFVNAFHNGISDAVVENITYKDIEDITYNKLNKQSGTKDRTLVEAKLSVLEKLMLDYLHINIEEAQSEKSESEEISALDFVRENVGQDVIQEDIEFCKEMLDELTLNVDNKSKLLDKQNHNSLIALVQYSNNNEIDLDDWIVNYFSRNSNYIMNQKQNFEKMLEDLNNYISKKEKVPA